VEVAKGPYFVNQGDFATAGAVNMVSHDDLPQSSLGFGFGASPGHGEPAYRALVIASPKLDGVKATFAAEIGRSNGPFVHPEGWDKLKLGNKLTFTLSPASTLSVGELSYASEWHGSGQVPARAVQPGLVSRYGSIDPSEGGDAARWLAADLDLTFTHSAFTQNTGNGHGLALAPKQTWSGGLSARKPWGPGTARAGLRFYGIAARPASDDGVIQAPGFTQIDLHLGYRHERFDLSFDLENLLDQAFRSAQFATVSRLPSEPAIGSVLPTGFSCGHNARLAPGAAAGRFYGCEEVDFTPAYPLALRLTAALYVD
jgi:hypothetical protein